METIGFTVSGRRFGGWRFVFSLAFAVAGLAVGGTWRAEGAKLMKPRAKPWEHVPITPSAESADQRMSTVSVNPKHIVHRIGLDGVARSIEIRLYPLRRRCLQMFKHLGDRMRF